MKMHLYINPEIDCFKISILDWGHGSSGQSAYLTNMLLEINPEHPHKNAGRSRVHCLPSIVNTEQGGSPKLGAQLLQPNSELQERPCLKGGEQMFPRMTSEVIFQPHTHMQNGAHSLHTHIHQHVKDEFSSTGLCFVVNMVISGLMF